MFNIPIYFEMLFNLSKRNDWTTPKALSESLTLLLFPNVKAYEYSGFYNKFYKGKNKGSLVYEGSQNEIKQVSYDKYIYKMADNFRSLNFKNKNFNPEIFAKNLLDQIKNATNLNGSVRSGLIHSCSMNYHENIYLFLAESLYYALLAQNDKNAIYVKPKSLMDNDLNFDDEPVWKRILSEETFLSEKFPPRFKQTLNLLTDKDVDTFLKLLELVVLDSDGEYYLYAPVTDAEVELYKKYGIGDREFFSMKEAGLVNLGERVDNKLTAYDSDFCGFQNDNLVIAIQADKVDSYQLNYKSYAFTQVGLYILELSEIETNDLFFTELANLVKQNYANAPVKVHLFSVEDIEYAENIEMVDFSKDILQ